jgi:O-antigen ligase
MTAMGLQGAFTAGEQWTPQSNGEAAGGMGPNQVAGLLALGAFTALFLSDLERRLWARLLYLGLAGVQVLSAVLTFTRGGSVILAIGLVLYASILLACRRVSVAVIGMGVIGVVVALIAIQVTNSVVIERFKDTEMSGREGIWSLGLRIFWAHPAFGVGTGNFYEASEGHLAAYHGRVGTHNEIIRALSEHGLVGATIWFAFIFSSLAYCWSEKRGLARAVSVSWLLMAVAFECHSGLKLSMSMLFMALVVEGFPCRYAGAARAVAQRSRNRRARWTRQRFAQQMADG